ncbi:hypothetical protein FBEOM_333 [Fusarium beomiforme]|uniref:Uncharacterized protein n=1 Tax=Fusarium beomiforme TaxID=44412 RepID=A0A9P5AW22_9HYPO|nr:hypothetical protein FBEOM_333 [Fusarium beomiforme]
MAYPSGREHYYEPLPLRASNDRYHPLYFSQRPRNNRPKPFDLGPYSNFDEVVSPASPITPLGASYARVLGEIDAIMKQNEKRLEERDRQRAAWLNIPGMERPSVNILEPPFRADAASSSSGWVVLPSDGGSSSAYSSSSASYSSPMSEHLTPIQVRNSDLCPPTPRALRYLDVELTGLLSPPSSGTTLSSVYSYSGTSEYDSPVLDMRPSECVPLLLHTPRSPRADLAGRVDVWRPIPRHPYRYGSYSHNRYDDSAIEEGNRHEENTGETWGDVWLDFLYLNGLFVAFILVLFVWACVVPLVFRAFSQA